MKKHVEIVKIDFPIIVFKFNPVEISLQEHAAFLKEQEDLLKQHSGAVFVFDLTNSKPLASEHRIQQGNWVKKNIDFLNQHLRGIVFVNQSIMMSIVLKGIFLIQKPPVPYTVVSNMEEGLVWARNAAKVNVAA